MVMKVWPEEVADHVICIVCRTPVHIENATVGDLYRDGRQAFACASHLHRSERLTWFAAWARFAIDQIEQIALTDLLPTEKPN